MGKCCKTSAADMRLLEKREHAGFAYLGELSEILKLDQYEKPIHNLITLRLYSLKRFQILTSLYYFQFVDLNRLILGF